jgi:hypothetical protein
LNIHRILLSHIFCNDAAVVQFVFGHTSLESSKKNGRLHSWQVSDSVQSHVSILAVDISQSTKLPSSPAVMSCFDEGKNLTKRLSLLDLITH